MLNNITVFFVLFISYLVILLDIKRDIRIFEQSRSIDQLQEISILSDCEMIIINRRILMEDISIVRKSINKKTRIFYYKEDIANDYQCMDKLQRLKISFTPCKIIVDKEGNIEIHQIYGFYK